MTAIRIFGFILYIIGILAMINPHIFIIRKERFYLINYSFNNGEGSFTVKVNFGELDLNYSQKYLDDNKELPGNKVIRGFQEISSRQYEQWNRKD